MIKLSFDLDRAELNLSVSACVVIFAFGLYPRVDCDPTLLTV